MPRGLAVGIKRIEKHAQGPVSDELKALPNDRSDLKGSAQCGVYIRQAGDKNK